MTLSFKELVVKECTEYYGKFYNDMKKFFYEQGLVGDVFDEIGKYFSIKDYGFSYYDEFDIKKIFKKYFSFKLFNYEEYSWLISKNFNASDELPAIFIPNDVIDVIVASSARKATENKYVKLTVYQIYSYKNFVITYKYSEEGYYNFVGALDDVLLQFIINNIKVHDAKYFDYKKYIIENKIVDIREIAYICEFFNKGNIANDCLFIIEELKKI
jgi:hypothetical protein